jgi:hypothetical protein
MLPDSPLLSQPLQTEKPFGPIGPSQPLPGQGHLLIHSGIAASDTKLRPLRKSFDK